VGIVARAAPAHVRLMLLSATVGNAPEFLHWLRTQHGRTVRLVQSHERRVPLEFVWVGDKLLTEHLPEMVSENDAENRVPALVFCFQTGRNAGGRRAAQRPAANHGGAAGGDETLLDAQDFARESARSCGRCSSAVSACHHAGVPPQAPAGRRAAL